MSINGMKNIKLVYNFRIEIFRSSCKRMSVRKCDIYFEFVTAAKYRKKLSSIICAVLLRNTMPPKLYIVSTKLVPALGTAITSTLGLVH